VFSLGLAAVVIVNAQFGCDSEATSAPAEDAEASTPTAQPDRPPTAKEAEASTPAAQPNRGPAAGTEVKAKNAAKAPAEAPVFMPASKSGGDFGAARFPGERQNPAKPQPQAQQAQQAQQTQQANPAPQP
jgi:hypothetical protein